MLACTRARWFQAAQPQIAAHPAPEPAGAVSVVNDFGGCREKGPKQVVGRPPGLAFKREGGGECCDRKQGRAHPSFCTCMRLRLQRHLHSQLRLQQQKQREAGDRKSVV